MPTFGSSKHSIRDRWQAHSRLRDKNLFSKYEVTPTWPTRLIIIITLRNHGTITPIHQAQNILEVSLLSKDSLWHKLILTI